MAKKSKRQAVSVPVPQSAAAADDAIRLIGECQRQLALLQSAQDEQLGAIRLRFAAEAKPYEDEVAALTAGLQVWCEANRALLTQDGKTKTARFASGEVSWRLRPPSVRLRDLDGVIARIRALGLARFLRQRVEVDKEAMLKEPEVAAGIDGVTIGSAGEDFVVTPFSEPLPAAAGEAAASAERAA